MTNKITPLVDPNKWLKNLDTFITNQSNFNKSTYGKCGHETLGTSVINSPLSPPSLH